MLEWGEAFLQAELCKILGEYKKARETETTCLAQKEDRVGEIGTLKTWRTLWKNGSDLHF